MKPWYSSRTIWLNVAFTLVAMGSEFGGFIALLPEDYRGHAMLVAALCLALGNFILRLDTSIPIGKENDNGNP